MRKLLFILTLLFVNNSYGFGGYLEPNVKMNEAELYTTCHILIKQSEIRVPEHEEPTRVYDCLVLKSRTLNDYCNYEIFNVTTHNGRVHSVSRSYKRKLSGEEKKELQCKN